MLHARNWGWFRPSQYRECSRVRDERHPNNFLCISCSMQETGADSDHLSTGSALESEMSGTIFFFCHSPSTPVFRFYWPPQASKPFLPYHKCCCILYIGARHGFDSPSFYHSSLATREYPSELSSCLVQNGALVGFKYFILNVQAKSLTFYKERPIILPLFSPFISVKITENTSHCPRNILLKIVIVFWVNVL